MGIERVTKKIIEDARKEGERIREEYRNKGKEIIERAEREAERIKKEFKERAEKEAEVLKRKILTQALLKIRKDTLTEKRRILDKVLDRAKEEILKDKEYPKLIRGLIEKYRESDKDEVILSSKDRERFAKTLKVNLADPADISGGVIVRSGKIDKNSSLETTLEEIRDELLIDLSKILFPD